MGTKSVKQDYKELNELNSKYQDIIDYSIQAQAHYASLICKKNVRDIGYLRELFIDIYTLDKAKKVYPNWTVTDIGNMAYVAHYSIHEFYKNYSAQLLADYIKWRKVDKIHI